MRALAATIVVAVAIVVVGCGDSDSPAPADASASADAATSAPDAAGPAADAACSPVIVESTPADGATGVDGSTLTAVMIRLDPDPDVGSLPGLLELRADDVQVSATVMLDSGSGSVTITPDAGFAADTAYTVVGPCNSIGFTTAP